LPGTLNEVKAVLSNITRLYSNHKNPHRLYCSIAREASRLLRAEKCSLMLADGDRNLLRISAATGLDRCLMENVAVRTGEGIAGKVYRDGVPILIDSEEGIRKYVMSPRPRYRTPSSLSLPLGLANEVIGVLNLSDKRSGKPFTENDLQVLSYFALQIFLILKLSLSYRESQQMRELSTTDFLTGLFNRRYFDIRLNEEYQLLNRTGGNLSFAILDIDDFKLFNDTEGHVSGDRVLKEMATIMAHTIRANDILVRFGGEEFAIIMPQTSGGEAFNVAERIRHNIKSFIQPLWTKFPKKQMTVSIGISVYHNCKEPIENVIDRADRALYKGKTQGKDCTVLYDECFGTPDSRGEYFKVMPDKGGDITVHCQRPLIMPFGQAVWKNDR